MFKRTLRPSDCNKFPSLFLTIGIPEKTIRECYCRETSHSVVRASASTCWKNSSWLLDLPFIAPGVHISLLEKPIAISCNTKIINLKPHLIQNKEAISLKACLHACFHKVPATRERETRNTRPPLSVFSPVILYCL